MAFRHGQWVRWHSPKVPGAHQSPGGFQVGIYQIAHLDGFGVPIPTRVVAVDGRGDNIPSGPGAWPYLTALRPEACQGLAAADVPADVPAARVAHLLAPGGQRLG